MLKRWSGVEVNDSVMHGTKCCKKNTVKKNLKIKVNKILKYSKNIYCYVNHFIDEQTSFVMKKLIFEITTLISTFLLWPHLSSKSIFNIFLQYILILYFTNPPISFEIGIMALTSSISNVALCISWSWLEFYKVKHTLS